MFCLPLIVIEMHYFVPRIIDIHCLTWRVLIFEEYLKNILVYIIFTINNTNSVLMEWVEAQLGSRMALKIESM